MNNKLDLGPCIICGKACPNPKWTVNFDAETATIIDPGVMTDGSGIMAIGPECVKTIPKNQRIRA